MNRQLRLALIAAAMIAALFTIYGKAQYSRTNQIFRPCSGTTTPASVRAVVGGDIALTPCSTKSITFGGTQVALTTTTEAATGGAFAINFAGWNGSAYTEGLKINSTSASAFVPFHIVLSNTAYGNSAYIAVGSSGLGFRSSAHSFTDLAGAKPLTITNGVIGFDRTITAGGTTGAQTINKPAGTVNFAAAAASLVVTNSLVTSTSLIFPVIRTADATCTFVKSVVAGAGTFTITMNAACTAETSVGFMVTN